MNPKNITFLIGAGASANTIPTVDHMVERIKGYAGYLKSVGIELIHNEGKWKYPHSLHDKIGVLNNLASDLDWLANQSINHQTIDTLARKYYLNNDYQNLKKLKRILIVFFKLEQLLLKPDFNFKDGESKNSFKKMPEQRYDALISAIARKTSCGLVLPKNVKILSWNYDIQFELALTNYSQHNSLVQIRKEFQILPNVDTYNEVNKLPVDKNRFSMVKLNGTALWESNYKVKKHEVPKTLFDKESLGKSENELLGELIEQYNNLYPDNNLKMDDSLKYFNFSWEMDDTFQDKYPGYNMNIKAAHEIAEQTEILVVIGYSFPLFNREIDKSLLTTMGRCLKKVYIQDLNPEPIQTIMQNSVERFQMPAVKGLPNITFVPINETRQFFLPYEFTTEL